MITSQAIVVGAGPSGLILGLLLAKQGIQVELLDAGAHLDKQNRASHYALPAAYELDRAGILDDVKARAFQPNTMAWRKPDTDMVAQFRLDCVADDRKRHAMIVLPLNQLGEILYEHIQRQPTARVRWAHTVVRVRQGEDMAWVDCKTPGGLQRFEADYVLGCDGASSTVRRELFGPGYPGETLNAQLIATDVCQSVTFSEQANTQLIHTHLYLGVLRLQQIQLLRHKLHNPPPKLLPSRPHDQNRPLARHLRGYPRSHPRRIHPATTDAVSRDPPGKPAAERVSHHQYQSLPHAAAMRAVVSRGEGASCCGCCACV